MVRVARPCYIGMHGYPQPSLSRVDGFWIRRPAQGNFVDVPKLSISCGVGEIGRTALFSNHPIQRVVWSVPLEHLSVVRRSNQPMQRVALP